MGGLRSLSRPPPAHFAPHAAGARRALSAGKHRLLLEMIGVLIPTALAGGLVLYDLGSRSLWLDEGFTFAAASQHGAALLHAALRDGGNALSYYVGMHYWMD